MLHIAVPGEDHLRIERLLLDVNGTLTLDGALLPGVKPRVRKLGEEVAVWLVSADTFRTAEDIAVELGAQYRRATTSLRKLGLLDTLGSESCAAIGNGRNDEALLREAALGIAVIGPEGATASALSAADIVCGSITDALDLLANPRRLAATLRP
jgi:P-type E1-E2 ATPase